MLQWLFWLATYTVELQTCNTTCEEKLLQRKATDKVMFSLLWDIEELKNLSSEGRRLRAEMSALREVASDVAIDLRQYNLPRKLSSLRENLAKFVKGITQFKRIPSTHIFVRMISCEFRNCKPCALPVQCMPYASLTEAHIRRLISKLLKEMVGLGMKVAGEELHIIFLYMFPNWNYNNKCIFHRYHALLGFVSDGEFNYMRSKGYTLPLSVLQIRRNVRITTRWIGQLC